MYKLMNYIFFRCIIYIDISVLYSVYNSKFLKTYKKFKRFFIYNKYSSIINIWFINEAIFKFVYNQFS